jgi:ABC-2 type transport system permease protein
MTTLTSPVATPRAAVPSAGPPRRVGQWLTLLGSTVLGRWRGLLAWMLGLVGMVVLQLSVYPSVADSAAGMQALVDAWPESLRSAFGLDEYGTGPGYLNAELFSLIIPLALIAIALGAAAAATAGEEERGTADLLLSQPIDRGTLLLARAAALVVSVTLAASVTALAIGLGAPLVDLALPTADLIAATATTALLAILFGFVGMLLGAITGRRAAALGGAMGLALAAFLLNVLAPMAGWLEPWQDGSPFHWALGNRPLTNGIDWAMAGLLLLVSAVLLVATIWTYDRRDIATR